MTTVEDREARPLEPIALALNSYVAPGIGWSPLGL